MNRRELLTAAAAVFAGGVTVADLASTIDAAPEPARLRTGRIVELLGAQQVVVDIADGQLVNMPCLAVDPVLGDVVQIIQQGPVQVVLGRTAPLSDDSVLANPSFEADAPGAAPSNWTIVNVGATSVTKTDTATAWGSVTGTQWMEVNQQTAGVSEAHVISEAIPVAPGELWTAAAWAMNASLDFDGGAVEILLTWYTTSTAMYPSVSAADTLVQSFTFPPGGTPGFFLLRQVTGSGVTVPVGVSYMRVVLSSYLSPDLGAAAYWDGIICRKLRGV